MSIVAAPAKLNLELRVLGRRPDGRHEIDALIQAISLADELDLTPRSGAERAIEVSGMEAPAGPDNLALRAAASLGVGARIRLTKRIPAGSGMGGGSSDAAAVLRALGGGRDDLHDLAAELGADVPFFLHGGRMRATGTGEKLHRLPLEEGWFAIAWPGFGVSTAAVYAAWDEVGGDGQNHLFRAAQRVEPRLAAFAAGLGEGWSMTGSGAAFFRPESTEAAARSATAGLSCWSAVARALPNWD